MRDGIGFSRKPFEVVAAIWRKRGVRSAAAARTWFGAATAAQRDLLLADLVVGLTEWPGDESRSPFDVNKERIG